MKLSDALNTLLNEQLVFEESASRQYKQAASWADANSYHCLHHFLDDQAEEEEGHFEKILDPLRDRGKPLMAALAAPVVNFGSYLDVLQSVLALEVATTAHLQLVANQAQAEDDAPIAKLMQCMLKEQGKAEKELQEMIARVQRAVPGTLDLLDCKLFKHWK